MIEQASKDHGVSLPTLYRWLRSCEAKGVAALLPKKFATVGKPRVTITRAWDSGCGLSEEVQVTIAAKLAAKARGLILKGRSEREVVRLCGFELRRLTEDAESPVSGMRLAEVCKLNVKFAKRFRDMRIVQAFDQDHKHFPDRHEFHVTRGLTARPMEVLVGDVHTVDLTSDYKAWFIAWMDGASGYMWVTPVLTRGNQGISQRDVANSLYEVVTCPWGGMPETFIIDNGGENAFISECVTRFAAMAELQKLNVIKCQPYHPEGKARLEGAFQIIEDRFLSHLPGYHGGKPRQHRKGCVLAVERTEGLRRRAIIDDRACIPDTLCAPSMPVAKRRYSASVRVRVRVRVSVSVSGAGFATRTNCAPVSWFIRAALMPCPPSS